MIDLPPKFKQALGNGVRTSLYPLVKIYKGIRIDDTIPDDAESINLSIKETTIKNLNDTYENYNPLLLNSPSIKSSADIINNKYTISSVSLSISNAPFQGKIFSDDVQSILNAVVQVYYCANGIDSIDDCLLVYTGSIRRFSQSSETIKLELEDLTQQMLSNKIPSSLIPDEPYYNKDDIGKPYPMVYGFVDKSPLISRGNSDNISTTNSLESFELDAPNSNIVGVWDNPENAYPSYGTNFLTQSHPLYQQQWINSGDFLFLGEDGNFIPINRKAVKEFYGEEYFIPYGEILHYFSIAELGVPLISLNNQGNYTSGSIRTRIFRPIQKVECFVLNQNTYPTPDAENNIYGFTGWQSDADEVTLWEPWDQSSLLTNFPYTFNWDSGDASFWQPTICNGNNFENGIFSYTDTNWIVEGRDGVFPVERLQNGFIDDGIYLGGRNSDGLHGEEYQSGGCFIKMDLFNNVPSLACSAFLLYQAEYHSTNAMDGANNPNKASFWTNRELIASEENFNDEHYYAVDLLGGEDKFPFVPNNDHSWHEISYPQHNSNAPTEQSIRTVGLQKGKSTSFENTDSFSSYQFGLPQIPLRGGNVGNDHHYCSVQLFNSFLLQDVKIDKIFDRTFYASIAGRGFENSQYPSQSFYANGLNVYMFRDVVDGVVLFSSKIYEFSFNAENAQALNHFHNTIFDEEIFALNFIMAGESYSNFPEYQISDNGYKLIIYTELEEDQGFDIGNYPVDQEIQFLSDGSLIENHALNPSNIIADIFKKELNYNADLNVLDNNELYSFTLNEQKEIKSLIEGITKHSSTITSYDSNGNIKFLELKNIIENINNYPSIKTKDILKYSFSLTKIDDIVNQVNVKYSKNYSNNEYDKETGYTIEDNNGNIYNNLDEITFDANQPEYEGYDINYYGINSEEAKLEVETEYIRDETQAKILQKNILLHYCNQHLIAKINLPASYMNLEVGDYISFDKLIGGKLAFGLDYTKNNVKNGQLIYGVFFITKITKSLDKIQLELIQLHRKEFGIPINEQLDDGIIPPGLDYPDPNENSSYSQDNIIDESDLMGGEDQVLSDFFYVDWQSSQETPQINNTIENGFLNASIYTNDEQEYNINISVQYAESEMKYIYQGAEHTIPQGAHSEGEIDASLFFNISKLIYDASENYSGCLEVKQLFNFYYTEETTGITWIKFRINITHESGTRQISFIQSALPENDMPMIGDINQDGILNILDVIRIIEIIESGEYNENADLNEDGIINILDVVTLINTILS